MRHSIQKRKDIIVLTMKPTHIADPEENGCWKIGSALTSTRLPMTIEVRATGINEAHIVRIVPIVLHVVGLSEI